MISREFVLNDVVVRLAGGLGNQMFQYAAARAVAIRSGTGLVVDLSWFATVSDRHYALLPFSINAQTLGPIVFERGRVVRFVRKITQRLMKRADKIWRGIPVFREKYFHFDPEVLDLRAPVCMDGYFQSEKYFDDCRDVIATEFVPANPPGDSSQAMLARISACNAICLHVRRGDYVANIAANAFHGTCSLDYYNEGLSIVSAGLANPHCFVFSDDPEWVLANFQLILPMTVVDIHGPDDAHEDLRLMSACQHFVIANSSLSWWGAWLGKDLAKRVVAPKRWFNNPVNDTGDLIPKAWKTI